MDMLEYSEKKKYQAIWSHDVYRKTSPALNHVKEAALEFAAKGTLYDFGCGQGLATVEFERLGFDACGVDITRKALAQGYKGQFIEACLWSAKLTPRDYGFCCDVMEHIPESQVDEALAVIKQAVKEKCYFSISLRDESHGMRYVGESLHATIKPAEWWKDKLSIWPSLVLNKLNDELIAIVSK